MTDSLIFFQWLAQAVVKLTHLVHVAPVDVPAVVFVVGHLLPSSPAHCVRDGGRDSALEFEGTGIQETFRL